ncbi:MAG: sodium:calcium antiporter [Chloroflexi bacterium]|nr:sodium:calcium antiporter [Chloroflexota bacterium]
MAVASLWLQLLGAAGIILVASTFLAKSADVIAIKTGLGRSFIGVVLLATATSLPELGLGVSSITLYDEPDLAAGDAFGSNIFNLLIIGLLDLYWRNGPILTRVSATSTMVAALGILIISLTIVAMIFHDSTTATSGWTISPVSIAIIFVFLAAMYMIYRFDKTQEGQGDVEQGAHLSSSLTRAAVFYSLSALVIVASALWLANIGNGISHIMGWEASFVGTQFLAFSTSLPELAASFAAIRINAPELAISNVLGSNLFNMGFILFMDDVALTGAPLWTAISGIHMLTAAIAILMTSVIVIALINRPRNRPSRFWTVEAVILIGLYLVSSVLVFKLG